MHKNPFETGIHATFEFFRDESRRRQREERFSKGFTKKRDVDEFIGMHFEKKIIFFEPSIYRRRVTEQKVEKFIDNTFRDPKKFGPQIQWRNISEEMKLAQIFVGVPNPEDCRQGKLGDCYFLAGLSALAQKPQRIYDLFLMTEEEEKKFLFVVKILYRGKWRQIVLDDLIPFKKSSNLPAFGHCEQNNQQLWVVLLEKAWAKLYKSYTKIKGGFIEEALHDLTGAPIEKINLQSGKVKKSEIWQELWIASQKNFAVVASSREQKNIQPQSGIKEKHAYTILHAYQLYKKDGVKILVLKLRNPHAKDGYKGRLSDKCAWWNDLSEKEKKKVDYRCDQNDGIFFIPFDNFLNNFLMLAIAKIYDSASYIYNSFFDKDAKGGYFKLIVSKKGKYCLQIHQKPSRQIQQKQYIYPQALIQVYKNQKKPVKESGNTRVVYNNVDLCKGEYIVFAKIQFDKFSKDNEREVTLSVYSESICYLELASKKDLQEHLQGEVKNLSWNPKISEDKNFLENTVISIKDRFLKPSKNILEESCFLKPTQKVSLLKKNEKKQQNDFKSIFDQLKKKPVAKGKKIKNNQQHFIMTKKKVDKNVEEQIQELKKTQTFFCSNGQILIREKETQKKSKFSKLLKGEQIISAELRQEETSRKYDFEGNQIDLKIQTIENDFCQAQDEENMVEAEEESAEREREESAEREREESEESEVSLEMSENELIEITQ